MSQHTELIARLRGLTGTLKSGAWSTIAEAADALQAMEPSELDKTADNNKVICPNCCHQFTAIPVNVQTRLQALERVPMTEEADELLRKWNLDPDLYRTDSGALNHMRIAAALKHPDDYPHTAQTAVKSYFSRSQELG